MSSAKQKKSPQNNTIPLKFQLSDRYIDLLSDHTVPDPDNLASALTLACPITERMIATGEIVLKNKEERGIFSDTGQFCTEMRTACTACKKTGDGMQEYSGCSLFASRSREDEFTGTGKNPA